MQAGLPSRYIARADLEFVILSPPPPACWGDRHVPAHLVDVVLGRKPRAPCTLLGQPVLAPPGFVKLSACVLVAAMLDKHDFIYL